MFPINMLKFTDKFEFNKAIAVSGGGIFYGRATVYGGLWVYDAKTILYNGLEVVRLPLNQGIQPPGAIISDLVVKDSFTLDSTIAANLGRGFYSRAGVDGVTNTSNVINLNWDGSKMNIHYNNIIATNLSCDYRIKENIQPPSNVLDRLCSLNMFNYELKDISIFKKNGTHLGVYAHELQDAFPELNNIVNGEKDELTLDGNIQPQSINPEFTNLLLKGLQELNLKVVELENKIIELENKS
jgi:hypothetical protein